MIEEWNNNWTQGKVQILDLDLELEHFDPLPQQICAPTYVLLEVTRH